jgi:hypothetical protein
MSKILNKNRRRQMENSPEKQQKWGLFTYFGNEVRSITKTFNKFHVKTTFRTKNTIGKLVKPTEEMHKYENSGTYL